MSENNKGTILVIQNDETDPPHLAGRWLMELGFQIRILRAFNGEKVPTTVPEDICAIMPMGGHMGALDDHLAPWLPDERALLADAVKKDISIFAICLGTQLLAAATGGVVSRAQTPEIGIYEIKSTGVSDAIFNLGASTIATQWHEDKVTKLPEGAVCLASSENCENQIYKMGSNTYGVQFHPEVDAAMVQIWEDHADNAYQTLGKKNIRPEVDAVEAKLVEIWKPIIQNWGLAISTVR
jgi:GMP synthase-like glutamine amidotransferase